MFQTLEKLNPDNEDPFYLRSNFLKRNGVNNNEDDEITQYLQMAIKIDEIARVWLQFVFQQAAEHAMNEKTKEWIAAATPFAESDEVSLISHILSRYNTVDDKATENIEVRTGVIERRIEQLYSFREFSEHLITLYKNELNCIQSSENPITDAFDTEDI